MSVTAIRGDTVDKMLHAIGYGGEHKAKRGKYVAWRNRYCTSGPSAEWENLVAKGLAVSRAETGGCMPNGAVFYFLTRAGLDFLQGVIDAKIVEGN